MATETKEPTKEPTKEIVRAGQDHKITFSQEEETSIRNLLINAKMEPTDAELKVFLYSAQLRGLNPLVNQIYFMKRKGKEGKSTVSHQTSIDGFRLIAQRTGEYEGLTMPQWCGDDGVWRDVWLKDEPPKAARIGAYRKNCREAFYAVALYKEYVQTYKDYKKGKVIPNHMWSGMPSSQLSKCAESLALRKAFPEDLGGLYTTDEMGQADNNATAPAASQEPQEDMCTPELSQEIVTLGVEIYGTRAAASEQVGTFTGGKKLKDTTLEMAIKIRDALLSEQERQDGEKLDKAFAQSEKDANTTEAEVVEDEPVQDVPDIPKRHVEKEVEKEPEDTDELDEDENPFLDE